jgi:methylenetetrahydrofolate reductase (NADPH)
MCGNCLLQETAFICPMECPKGLRNGPCGGITPEYNCYVDPTRKCIWHAIYVRAVRTGREKTLLEVLPPLDWQKTGTETWGEVLQHVGKTGFFEFTASLFSGDKERKEDNWNRVFRTIRQPEWWKGDDEYHKPGYAGPVSELERKFRAGEFVVATEVTPPLGSAVTKLTSDIDSVKDWVTAINFTDSSSARAKMSSLACCSVAVSRGAEPVLQVAARDTTRAGLQGTAIGMNAIGISNVLCITGDNPLTGSAPVANLNFVDLDSVQMIWILRKMRDEGIYLDGRKIKNPPRYFIGAASSPFASDPYLQAIKDQKKVNAGAQFFQTNLVFEPDRLDAWLENLDRRNVLGKVFILVGVAPVRSLKAALYLRDKVPGVKVPDSVIGRLERAGDGAAEEGVQIALEVIEKVKGKKGVNGIHIMTLGWEEIVERLVREGVNL